jgi:hypothetical protein
MVTTAKPTKAVSPLPVRGSSPRVATLGVPISAVTTGWPVVEVVASLVGTSLVAGTLSTVVDGLSVGIDSSVVVVTVLVGVSASVVVV